MFDFQHFFADEMRRLKRENHYRVFRELKREAGQFPRAQWLNEGALRAADVWCSNDYLGMSQHPVVLEAAQSALLAYGAGAGGTRNISGTTDLIVALERELAKVHGKQAGLVFSSGYVANETSLATLARALPDCVVFSDAANHASMIAGIKNSRRICHVFRHNDVAHLTGLLANLAPGTPAIVAIESLYSMDGDTAPLAELLGVAKSYGALTFVDETHAVGVHGSRGGGVLDARGLTHLADVIQGGLGKGYGVVGGFITGCAELVDFVRSHAPGFIFTTALPPAVAAAALASVRHLTTSQVERDRLFARVARVRAALNDARVPLVATATQILPLIVGEAARCRELADRLLERHGVYLQAIAYPTVARGAARLRITPSPLHNDEQQLRLVAALAAECRSLDLTVAAA